MLGSKRSQKHIAVLAFPLGTHAPPLLTFIRRLSEASPDLKFSFFSTAQSNASLFSKNDVFDRIKPCDVEDGLPEGYVFKGNPSEPAELFVKATPGNFERAIEKVVEETGMDFCCLIADSFYGFAAEMAEKKRVPWISFWTSGPRALLAHLETDSLREKFGPTGAFDEGQILEGIPGFSTIRIADIPDGIISGILDSPLLTMLHRMAKMTPRATVVVANSFEELDPVVVNFLKSRLNHFLNIGPFSLTCPPAPAADSHGCIKWLDKRERSSVAYISFGSMITPPPPELTALAEALEESRTPFLWSIRGDAEENLPKGFVERTKAYGKIVPWAPQLEVLKHSAIGVFVTHGGWNSVTESIICGVPMICSPFFGDQGLNQRTLETVWGIGLGLEGGKLTKTGTMKALQAILFSGEGKKMRDAVAALKLLAFQAVESQGSSTANFKALIQIFSKF